MSLQYNDLGDDAEQFLRAAWRGDPAQMKLEWRAQAAASLRLHLGPSDLPGSHGRPRRAGGQALLA
eukprot:CAMPEP_0115848658 /NCGR_PEP_ID=MMETSP0287-20121206/11039_1 /TAXON_ID=412157 /ORGANISM="Chrysochromulina rotalis, Strain UIO044" /LENGTH=65 /DNA_ID=CAMNT_0003302585 /DNA_START=44 /DNA_END=239 /DNA_ORIENTATION=-